MRYFVMLNGGGGFPLPMVDDDDNTVLYKFRSDAEVKAEMNPLGMARGYKIFPWPFYEGEVNETR